jgi:dihydroorotate dehydrogenase
MTDKLKITTTFIKDLKVVSPKPNLIPFNDYPRFLTIDNTTNINDIDLTNNNVRIILNDKNDKKNEQLINKLKEKEPLNINIKWNNNEDEENVINDNTDIIDKEQILLDYINKINKPDYIKPDTLNKIIKSILNEIKGG